MWFDLLLFELDYINNDIHLFIGGSVLRCFGVDKDRELGEAQAEIKALRFSERLREKAVEEVISPLSISVICSVV